MALPKGEYHINASDTLLNRAMQIAVRAHEGANDRYGAPYILHPLGVMMNVPSVEEKIVAILHDTVEDAGITLDYLRSEGFPENVVIAIDSISRREGESYDEYMNRVMADDLASRVKIADLQDNMDLRRIPDLNEEAIQRLLRYHSNWKKLVERC
jgi:(p)ppGpp synthase/HD superfamily hydrolase